MTLRSQIVDKILRFNEKYVFERRLKKFFFNNSLIFNNVIDVGSNTGQTIDFFLKMNSSCKVFGFEPDPDLFAGLVSKFGQMGNVYLSNFGVSDIDGTKTFYKNVIGSTSSLEPLDLSSKYLKKKALILGVEPADIITNEYPVNVCTLYTFLMKLDTVHFDLLKIDTEGHELACLKGLFSKKTTAVIDRIQIENHNDDMYRDSSEEINALLQANGYFLESSISHGFGGIEDLIYVRKEYESKK